jgi:hypothetical protein
VVSGKWEVLGQGWISPYYKAKDDKRWKKAHEEWGECMAGKGYKVLGDEFNPEMPDDATDEMMAKAFVACAQCSDERGTAKTAARVEAEYQMDYIAEHEAELVEIQTRTRALIAEAEAVVNEAGFSWKP